MPYYDDLDTVIAYMDWEDSETETADYNAYGTYESSGVREPYSEETDTGYYRDN